MKSIFLSLLLMFALGRAFSQNTNSPYSILGIGDIEDNFYNRTSGMANTGLAYRNDRFPINNNPSSYTALQDRFFNFEITGRGQFASYTGTNLDGTASYNKDFAIKHVAVSTKVKKWWGTGAGFMPFTTSSYLFNTVKTVQGTNATLPVTYDGTGGINQVYWNNSFQPFKHFSFGVNSAYLFGSLSQKESLTNAVLLTSLATTRQLFLKGFHFNFGAQYYTALSPKWDLSLGGVYAPQQKLAADGTLLVQDNGVTIATGNVKIYENGFKLPYTSGFGISLTKNHKYTFLADYRYQAWSTVNFSGINYDLVNSNRASIGFEVSNKLRARDFEFEKSFVQAGAYYSNSYISINGDQLKDVGFTIGYGLFRVKDAMGTTLGFMSSLDVGQRFGNGSNLIRETYVNLNLTFTYRNFWRKANVKYF